MFTSQCSLQESIDGEDKSTDLDPEEEAPPGNFYYALYEIRDDSSVILIDTNLPSQAEPDVQSHISKRLGKGTLLFGIGSTATLELSIPEKVIGCYHCLFQQDKHGAEEDKTLLNYVVCFLGSTEKGLELFRVELDGYVQELPSSLILQESDTKTEIGIYVSSWYEDSIMYIHRVVLLAQEKISSLLHAALRRTPVNVLGADDKTKQDIERFLNAASVHGLAQEDVSSTLSCGESVVEPQKGLLIDCSQLQPTFLNEGKNRFCEEWSQAFLNSAEGGNAFLLRQILENFKLKAIQDLNNLKRLVRQAETSHYALYRCYTFLQNCGNGDVLLQNVKVEYAEMPEAGSIVQVLEEFSQEEALSHLD
ncbi:protein Njmu-R1 [Erpetoichthys calabaricus]|uniref:protein Njmu-R1 n=1 Tax=Erpetoichthys calabaricus TaxID=27687 RepID=UPI00109F12AD|nr:protein Njmu-R1 [Erpetoichthys calabaricus]